MKIKRVLAIILVASLIVFSISALTITASAVGGSCGTGVTWDVNIQTYELTISGKGAMKNYSDDDFAPWANAGILSVKIEAGVTAIGNYAFYGLNKLKTVEISNTVESIGENAFRYCSVLRSVEIPGSVKTIGKHAFGQCSSLKNIKFYEGLESVGDYAFYYCGNLEAVTFPSTVKTFGTYVFYHCRNFMKVNIPYGVTEIPSEMFKDCESLMQITLPSSVNKIGTGAFSGCKNLKTVNYGGTSAQKALITVEDNNGVLDNAEWLNEQCKTQGHSPSSKWCFDENEHWHICNVCGEKVDIAGHTDTDDDLCDICGAPYVAPKTYFVSGAVTSFGDENEDVTLKLFAGEETESLAEIILNGNYKDYIFADLSAGEYTLTISKKNHIDRIYEIQILDEDITLNPIIKLIGDINADGFTDKKDLNALKKHINETVILTGYDFDVVNFNHDEFADKKDLNVLKKHINETELLY